MISLIPFFLIVLIIAYLVISGRAFVSTTGMSETNPVCAHCYYRLGGWSSSHCPECGEDVCTVGVRVGARRNAVFLGLILSLVSTIIVATLANKAARWVFQTRIRVAEGFFGSTIVPEFVVTTWTHSRWQRFPSKDTRESMMILHYASGIQSSPQWQEGYYYGSEATLEQDIFLTASSGLSSDSEIEYAVRKILEPEIEEDVIMMHVNSLKELARALYDPTLTGSQGQNAINTLSSSWSDDTFSNPGTGGAVYICGRSNGARIMREDFGRNIVIVPLSIAICTWMSILFAKRVSKPAWRLPSGGEWK